MFCVASLLHIREVFLAGDLSRDSKICVFSCVLFFLCVLCPGFSRLSSSVGFFLFLVAGQMSYLVSECHRSLLSLCVSRGFQRRGSASTDCMKTEGRGPKGVVWSHPSDRWTLEQKLERAAVFLQQWAAHWGGVTFVLHQQNALSILL